MTTSLNPEQGVGSGEKTMKATLFAAVCALAVSVGSTSFAAGKPSNPSTVNATGSMQALLEGNGPSLRMGGDPTIGFGVPRQATAPESSSAGVSNPWSSPFTWNPNIGGAGG
jgi:hypothetical protein